MAKNNFKVSYGNVCGNVSKICKRLKSFQSSFSPVDSLFNENVFELLVSFAHAVHDGLKEVSHEMDTPRYNRLNRRSMVSA